MVLHFGSFSVMFIVENHLTYLFLSIWQEIRVENELMMESKNFLDDQISGYKEKLETYSDYENDFIHYKQHLEKLTTVRIPYHIMYI